VFNHIDPEFAAAAKGEARVQALGFFQQASGNPTEGNEGNKEPALARKLLMNSTGACSMSFLKKLFGENTPPKLPVVPPPIPAKQSPAMNPATDPNMVRVYDDYGREMFISKGEWRKNVLPGTIKAHWNKPDDLYNIIVSALNDGFRSDVVGAAEQLFKMDPQRVRGACIWGIVLTKEGRLNEAEKTFRDFTSQHGEDGSILTNLAKVYAERKDDAKAEEVLWHALEVDPNLDNGLLWYEVIHREKNGEEAGQQALRRVAALPKSWRAHLWIARHALKHRDLAGALNLYQQSLAAAPSPAPHDLLMQMSGDLGNAGHLAEVLNLVLPRFDVAFHGLQVGNNLIKAMLDLGQIEPARRILQQLYTQNRPDWKQALSFWDTELAKLSVEIASFAPPQPELKTAMLTIDGPVWLPDGSPAQELFPAVSAPAVRVAFLGSSAEMPPTDSKARYQMSDPPGRLSRALPLFLAEQVRFGSDATVRTLVPWLHGNDGAFLFRGAPWQDADAAQYARVPEPPCDYVVITHLNVKSEPWSAELRLVRTMDGKRLATASCSFHLAQPEEALQSLARQLLAQLIQHAEVKSAPVPANYRVPDGLQFSYYLVRLEQLVAVRCAGMDNVSAGALSGTHTIVDNNLALCLNNPGSVPARILLLQMCRAMKRVHPEVVAPFRDKLLQLQREHPLVEPAQVVCQHLLNEVLAA
jgi:tetratricopeptide (TPR) repeat protein